MCQRIGQQKFTFNHSGKKPKGQFYANESQFLLGHKNLFLGNSRGKENGKKCGKVDMRARKVHSEQMKNVGLRWVLAPKWPSKNLEVR